MKTTLLTLSLTLLMSGFAFAETSSIAGLPVGATYIADNIVVTTWMDGNGEPRISGSVRFDRNYQWTASKVVQTGINSYLLKGAEFVVRWDTGLKCPHPLKLKLSAVHGKVHLSVYKPSQIYTEGSFDECPNDSAFYKWYDLQLIRTQ